MMGYMEATSPKEAVTNFFDQAPYPIRWEDVEYMWAEQLGDQPATPTMVTTAGSTSNPCAAAGTGPLSPDPPVAGRLGGPGLRPRARWRTPAGG